MIVANANSTESLKLAQYYAQARNIPTANIVQVYVPNTYYLTQTQFLSLQNQLLKFMVQNTLTTPSPASTGCGGGNYNCSQVTNAIQSSTKIRYVTMMRGMPARIVFTNSTLANPLSPAALDNYLVHYLLMPFTADTIQFSPLNRAQAFGNGQGMRTVIPSQDGELIVGRIDGLDYNSAQALIDRAIEAENNGIFGTVYSSQYGLAGYDEVLQWYNYQNYTENYGAQATAWQYFLGIFNSDQSVCRDYWQYPDTSSQSEAPLQCGVRFSDDYNSKNGIIGTADSNVRDVIANSLVYMGELDGQEAGSSFENLLNWRKNSTCTQTLCRLEANPAACQANSIDPYHEFDTTCLGVNPGFMGYNFISWPQAYFAAWPTGWNLSSNVSSWGQASLADLDSGDDGNIALPFVVNDDGADDSYSMWFRRLDDVANPVCYASTDLTQAPTTPCPESRYIYFTQEISMPSFELNTLTPQTYTISMQTKGLNVPAPFPLYVWIGVYQTNGTIVPYPNSMSTTALMATIPAGNSAWTPSQITFQLNPALHTACGSPCMISGLKLFFLTAGQVSGDLGVDMISVKDTSQNIELITNGSFNQGHENVNTGDWGAQFLSRLGGTAFWGSMGHHESNGHSFSTHVGETMIYFFRGLPLGDAVWFSESHNNGILYGDPLYNPVAVMIHYTIADSFNRFNGSLSLIADTVNGKSPSNVTTSYAVSTCPGQDFYACDTNQTWVATGLSGVGGQRSQTLGTLSSNALPLGWNVIRLSVTSTSIATKAQQTINDYYVVSNWGACPVSRFPATTVPTDPSAWSDADGDGVLDPCDGNVLGGATWVPIASNDTLASFGLFEGYTQVQYLNGVFVAIGSYGSLQYSTDGIHWSSATPSENNEEISSLSVAGNYFIAVLGNNAISYSSDGVHWYDLSPQIGSTGARIVYGDGKYLAWTSSTQTYTSPDLQSWTTQASWPFSCTAGNIVYGNKFVAVCKNTNTFGVSSDGVNWVQATAAGGFASSLTALTYSQNTYVAVGGLSEIQTSSDGLHWSAVNSGGTNSLASVACNGATCVAVGSGGILRTTNFASWSSATAAGGFTAGFSSVTYGYGLFTAVGNSGMIQTSPDGATWTAQTGATVPDDYFNSARYLNGNYVAVGTSSNTDLPVIQTSLNGTNWVIKNPNLPNSSEAYDIAYGNGVYVVVGDQGGISTSADLNTFTARTPAGATTRDFYAVAFNSALNRFVAAGENGNLQYSSDGVNWTAANLGGSGNVTAIQVSNGNFVAVYGNAIITSATGINWTTVVSSGVYNGGIVCNGLTCMASSTSNSLWLSTDGGQFFSQQTTPVSNYAWAEGSFVDWAGGTWYLVVSMGISDSFVYVSTNNGATWSMKSEFNYDIFENQISGIWDGSHYFMPTISGLFLKY